MDREATPTLHDVPGVDLAAYKRQLIERFANPEVRDTLARLCAESSDRIPKWLVPVIRHNLENGGEIERSALVVASWARYAEGVDEQGEPIEVVDQLKDRVMAAARTTRRTSRWPSSTTSSCSATSRERAVRRGVHALAGLAPRARRPGHPGTTGRLRVRAGTDHGRLAP